jgi:transposase
MEIPGVGPLVSTALVAAIGNGVTFRKGRDLAAWLGLVPRQYTTGGKPKLSGISKRGNEYLRRMFLHGSRSVVMQMESQQSALGSWLGQLAARAHRNVVVVALANKMARVAWALLNTGGHYHAPDIEGRTGKEAWLQPSLEIASAIPTFPNPTTATRYILLLKSCQVC